MTEQKTIECIEKEYMDLYRIGHSYKVSLNKISEKEYFNKRDILKFILYSNRFNTHLSKNMEETLHGTGKNKKILFGKVFSGGTRWKYIGLIGFPFGIMDIDLFEEREIADNVVLNSYSPDTVEIAQNIYGKEKANLISSNVKPEWQDHSLYLYSNDFVHNRKYYGEGHKRDSQRFVFVYDGGTVSKVIDRVLWFIESNKKDSYMLLELKNPNTADLFLLKQLIRTGYVSTIEKETDKNKKETNIITISSQAENKEVEVFYNQSWYRSITCFCFSIKDVDKEFSKHY